jgi:hypothetical protein
MSQNEKPVTQAEMRAAFGEFEQRMERRFEDMSEQMRDIETALLRAFQNYAQSVTAQFQKLNVADGATEVRLTALEGRVLELETRRGH